MSVDCQRARAVRSLAAVLAVTGCFFGAGCGYSEDEWQAQLAKYSELDSQHKRESAELAETKKQLDGSQTKVAQLTAELEKMGVNVDQLSRKLAEEGTEKERLSADVNDLKQAVSE